MRREKIIVGIFTLIISCGIFGGLANAKVMNGGFLADFSDVLMEKLLIGDNDYPSKVMARGEAVNRIVEAFDLKTEKSAYIADCMAHADECFFVFSAMSDFDGITFQPLRLYPDVKENFRYYDAINIASILGLAHGYLNEKGTPFKPEHVITRIQALKIVMASAEMIQWKERFELDGTSEKLPFKDVNASDPAMWWYPRYLATALDKGIIDEYEYFRPNEPITLSELAEMVDNTLKYKEDSADDTQIYARGDSER